jgi:hypothetical protein
MPGKVLLHICCGPCGIHPVEALREEGFLVQGFFFNPNIQPFQEHERRREALAQWAAAVSLPVTYAEDYDLEGWLRMVVFREKDRCPFCSQLRLAETARQARSGGFDGFSSTLLYSRHQDHARIREQGEALARTHGVPFLYRDFRAGWNHGIEVSKEMGLYRQGYCGCVFSERDRYRQSPRSAP